LILGSLSGCIIASHLEGKIAAHCAVDLQRAVQ
jgi:hypothetical protein